LPGRRARDPCKPATTCGMTELAVIGLDVGLQLTEVVGYDDSVQPRRIVRHRLSMRVH
jgi:hypothetical protein